ncbi:reverse transcriptase [Purpureocillium lilacinum]|uniref:Reverse transcriptase n=1 Tax=Purpureocillium lilacinum TaxID=33203 RepID=A0A179F609_PURLI|nr:reverse transcriptase [Purpureocillium lilacinum]
MPPMVMYTVGRHYFQPLDPEIFRTPPTFGSLPCRAWHLVWLPTNHFGARKQRSAEQALMLLQEQIYAAWRGRRILSLVSFDVKGAYEGVCKARLIQRMRASGLPEGLLRWVEAFCSNRTAALQVNGQSTDARILPQQQIDCQGGSVAFADDYTAWVTGPTAQSNRAGIEAIINRALDWERRSGATFEAEKTSIIHFTRKAFKFDTHAFAIKGQIVEPKRHVKVLGMIMDSSLKYKEHMARASAKGLESAMELQRLRALNDIPVDELETINPFSLAPWAERIRTITDDDDAATGTEAGADGVMHVAVSSSARNGLVGSGAVIELSPTSGQAAGLERHSFTLGLRTEQNPFSGELAAIAQALRCLPEIRNRSVEVLTSNKAAVLTLRNPRQQSGQQYVDSIHETIGVLRDQGNAVTVTWVPVSSEHGLLKLAKDEAREATREDATPAAKFPRARSTTLGIARAKQRADNKIPSNFGDFTKRIDGANVLAQLRTGMARLNDYLYRIKAAASQQCACGHARETVDHFLFRCTRWTAFRTEMMQCTDTQRGNISFFLGGKQRSDNGKWAPNMEAVWATIRYALATGRLENTHH